MATNRESSSMFSGHFISAPGRSCGKSLLSMGLARYASRQGKQVQTFKKGPDYIDPLWLKAASANSCYNLDPYTQSNAELRALYQRFPAQLVLVEGTMGLHDGLAADGSDCNGAVAKLLGLPVLLVIDCRGMHRTIAAIVNGLTGLDPAIEFSGVVLNRVRTTRHGEKIERAISQYCDVPLLGKIPESGDLAIDERELGLVSALDHPAISQYADRVADVIAASCDVHTLVQPENIQSEFVRAEFDQQPLAQAEVLKQNVLQPKVAQADSSLCGRKAESVAHPVSVNAGPSACSDRIHSIHSNPVDSLRVGLARDEAFHFYYEDDLQELRSRGVDLVEFSPIRDKLPEGLNGLFIGGGFPERHLQALSANVACREALGVAIASGLPVRAECGGLMYLCNSIEAGSTLWPMVGAIQGVVKQHAKPQGRGYMRLKFKAGSDGSADAADGLPAHEFHHSSVSFENEPDCLFDIIRGHGLDGQRDGVCINNVIASYAHLRHTAATPWVDWFLDRLRQVNYTKQSPGRVSVEPSLRNGRNMIETPLRH